MRLNNYYNDRGIQKYNGFYLSEHNATIEKEISRDYKVIEAKEKMEEDDIYNVIDNAIMKHCSVSVQIDIRDIQGQFMEDVVGWIYGYQDDYIYINHMPIPLSQIRHIAITTHEKWFI